MKNKLNYLVAGSVLAGSLLVAGTSFATSLSIQAGMMGGDRAPQVYGTVSAVNGSVLTVNGKAQGENSTAGTYTVDVTSATIIKNGVISNLAGIAVGDNVSVSGTISGTSIKATSVRDGMMGAPRGGMMGGDRGRGNGGNNPGKIPGVYGTVASVNGNTFTVTARMGGEDNKNNPTTTTTFTVDATNAKIMKAGVAGTISSVVVGDTVMVQGTVTGTNVVATMVRDGMMGPKIKDDSKNNTPFTQGNGQPILGGNVTSVNGNTITITNKSNVVYTVDLTNSKIQKGNVAGTVSSVAVGDTVVVQGTINGNSIVASSVLDSGVHANVQNGNGENDKGNQNGEGKGFFGSIGNFFKNLFGF